MKNMKYLTIGCALTLLAGVSPASAFVQFPYDIDNFPRCWTNAVGTPTCPAGNTAGRGPEDVDWNNDGIFDVPANSQLPTRAPTVGPFLTTAIPGAVFMQLAAGDGMAKMADGSDMYTFGFSNLTNIRFENMFTVGSFHAELSAPTIDLTEGQALYLTLSNVGMVRRPDLFDPHTVHFHGYPNAATVFDGEPMASFGIRMMQDLTYFYKPGGPLFRISDPTGVVAPSECVDPGFAGTYMYHCHVEATEHMEMGMLGNSVIRPSQNGTAVTYAGDGRTYSTFAYNDCLAAGDPLCGSTGYDVEKLIQFTAFDPNFHQADLDAQPPPFSTIVATYFLFNGRGYPDTVKVTPASVLTADGYSVPAGSAIYNSEGYASQKLDAKVTATSNQTILLRLSNLSIKDFISIEAPGLTFNVIGMCARQLRNPGPDEIYGNADDQDLSYLTNSLLLGPGETADVIVRTVGVPVGTYYLISRNLDQLNNNGDERGGAMSEITIQ